LIGNKVANNGIGIMLAYSSDNNVLSGNDATASNQYGIYLDSSSDNTLSGNDVAANKEDGIWLRNCSGNKIFHNNFSNNTYQTYVESSINTWDDGYPSGGNYWSDYDGVDTHSGPYQNETGSDGKGDTPYTIDMNNRDKYPLLLPRILGDVNGDGTVNILDSITIGNSFLAKPGNTNWNPNADVNCDDVINILDSIVIGNHFLETAIY
jgi:parallel beta-helix repeat protein